MMLSNDDTMKRNVNSSSGILSVTLCKTGPRISGRKKVSPQTSPCELSSVVGKWKAFSLWKSLKGQTPNFQRCENEKLHEFMSSVLKIYQMQQKTVLIYMFSGSSKARNAY